MAESHPKALPSFQKRPLKTHIFNTVQLKYFLPGVQVLKKNLPFSFKPLKSTILSLTPSLDKVVVLRRSISEGGKRARGIQAQP